MQGLIHVLFGVADVVVELAGDGVPHLVDHAQRPVTVRDLVDQYTQGEQVVDVAELLALGLVLLHLPVGTVYAFRPADHLSGDAVLGKFIAKPGGDFLDVVFAFGALGRQYLGYLPVLIFVQVSEGQVIQPPLDLPYSQAVGQRGVDVQSFLGDTPAFIGRQGVQGAHVVQTVGQLDQNHPDVFGHRDQHLPQALGVQRFGVVHEVGDIFGGRLELVVHAGQLGDPVHQLAHFRSKAPGYLVERDAAVFDNVMEQSGDNGVGVEAEVGEEEGGFQGVGDVGLAGFSHLPYVAFVGVAVCLPHESAAFLGQVSTDPFYKGLGRF